MVKILNLFLMIFFMACSSSSPEKRALSREEWIGHSTQDLENHPYFKHLPLTKKKHENGGETWIFRDQSRYQTGAYCQSLGGCMGMPFYNCDNAFSVKNGKILAFEQNGTCPPIGVTEVQKKSKE